MADALHPAPTWQPAAWQGEKSLVTVAQGWKAVVSLERGRLMHFGPSEPELNLLLAPPTRDNPDILGGHRVWLGPQANWSEIWPPPQAWELSGPETCTTRGGELRLLMPDSGAGWPRLTRTYRWAGAQLVCGVELTGGTRPAQIIHIFQMPAPTVVSAEARAVAGFPLGYVRLPSKVAAFAARFDQPLQVTRRGNALTLRHSSAIEKLGFRPQTLSGRNGSFSLAVTPDQPGGAAIGEPDEGFLSQVYLGGSEAFIELEQLSPLFAAGAPAAFTVVLEGQAQ